VLIEFLLLRIPLCELFQSQMSCYVILNGGSVEFTDWTVCLAIFEL